MEQMYVIGKQLLDHVEGITKAQQFHCDVEQEGGLDTRR